MAKRGAKLGTSVLSLDVEDSKFTAGLAKNKAKAKSWTDSIGTDVKRGLGQGLGIGVGLGVAGAVTAAVSGVQAVVAGSISAAMEWESAFAGVRKTVDASETEFAELEGAIRGMAKEIPIGSTELAGLAEAAGALGVAKGDILEFTRVTALIGTTTDVSSGDAATALGQLSNVLGLTNKDYEKFGSTLVDLGNKGASTESQILQIASRAGAGSKLIGMATDETLGWASSVANLGIEVEAGGSALQKFFLDTAKGVSSGGDKLETYARIAGVSAAEFKRAFEEDASGALQLFLAGLGELTQGEQLKALADLDFNDVRITRTLLGLANGADMVGESLAVASDAWQENTALMAEAEKRFDTTESKLIILGNRVNDLGITFGETLLPALVDVATFSVEAIEMLAGAIGGLIWSVKEMATWIDIYFGNAGKSIEDWANKTGRDVGETKDAVQAYMSETGASLEEAVSAVETYGPRNTAALQQAGMAWEEYQNQIRVTTAGGTAAVEEGVEGAEAALLAGEEGIDAAAGELFEPIDKEAQKARDAAMDHMKSILDGIRNMFDSDETLQEAFQALLDRMDDPYTEAERKADIFSQNTVNLIRRAIEEGDPAITQDTADLVNNMLAQFGLMEPGALERGGAVPPALQAGMDAQMQALIDFVEAQTGKVLDELTLEEAKKHGLDGIWLYAQGMKANQWMAKHEAGIAASRAVNALSSEEVKNAASAGGAAVMNSFMNGITATFWARNPEVVTALNYMKRQLGGSLPEIGPLAGPTAAEGGKAVGEAWSENLAAAIDLGPVADTLTSLSGLLSMPHFSVPSMPGASGVAHTFGGSGFDAESVTGGAAMYFYADFLFPPQGPVEMDRFVQLVGPPAEEFFVRNRRFERRPRN